MMEVFAGFLSHTDHHLGRLLDFLRSRASSTTRIVMVDLRQRRQRRGRPHRHDQRGAVLQQRPGAARGQPQGHRRDRRPQALQPLPVGLDLGRQHAVPALEARDLPRRRRATRSSSPGRPASRRKGEVRTQYAHIIDMVPTVLDLLGIEPPATIRGVTQSPIQGVSFAHTLDDAARAEPGTTPSTSRCSATAPSTTTAGGRSAPGRARRSPRPASASASRSRRRSSPSSTRTGWELYHVAEDFAENHNVAAENRDRLIALIATWYVEAGKYDVLPVDGSGLARMIAEKPLVAAAPRALHLPAGHPVGAVLRGAARAEPAAQHHRERRDPRGRRRGRAALPGQRRGRLLALHQGRHAPLRPQLGRPRALTVSTSEATGPGRRRTSCASSSSRPASRTCRTARARRVGSSSTSTALSSPAPRRRRPRRSCSTPAPSPAAPTPAPGHARLPEPVPVHRHAARGDRRRERRADHRPRGRAAGAHGPAVRGRAGSNIAHPADLPGSPSSSVAAATAALTVSKMFCLADGVQRPARRAFRARRRLRVRAACARRSRSVCRCITVSMSAPSRSTAGVASRSTTTVVASFADTRLRSPVRKVAASAKKGARSSHDEHAVRCSRVGVCVRLDVDLLGGRRPSGATAFSTLRG